MAGGCMDRGGLGPRASAYAASPRRRITQRSSQEEAGWVGAGRPRSLHWGGRQLSQNHVLDGAVFDFS